MMKYRKKPVVIEAWKFCSADWLEEPSKYPMVDNNPINLAMAVAIIVTLEGDMAVTDGDYIIKGVQGEFYPCKPDIFEATYEIVEQ
ncbi:hypothetical protein [Lactococcus lactis]|uniref:hypothetical protein n=1 Tax=Lactococcus lactis TaxID=1358 RepID=UPI003A4E2B0C